LLFQVALFLCTSSEMAEASISVGEDQFSCPICLDLLKDPVTIPCGHSYCMNCITDCWNQDDQKRVYSCPQCRQTFSPRPALNKNVVFAEMVEKLKKTKAQTARPALSYAGPGDVECDVCTGRKYKAVRSCLLCLNSYCQCHLEQHDSFFKDKRHNLINATGRLKEMICSQHDRLLEVYCRTDQQCICLLCTMNEHKNHHTISTKAERTKKQKQLWFIERKFRKRIQEREKEIQELKDAVKTHKHSAQAAVKDSERIFTELIRSIERRRSEVIQMIRDREKAELRRAEGLLKQLQQEIDDLRRRDAELQQLLHTENHIHFIQSFQSFAVPPASKDNISITSLLSYDDVDESVSMLREKLEDLCKKATENIYGKVKVVIPHMENVTASELRTRDEFLQCLNLAPQVLFSCISLFLCKSSEMAEASISVVQDQFSCSICLDLLKDPVTIPCGHSYCMNCIAEYWNQDDQKRVYSCPQCRQTFSPRPALNKNVMLAEMVEKLKTTKVQTVFPTTSHAGPGDVECDVCTGRKYKAVRSCLMCLNSYCQNHLKQHDRFFKNKKHNLVNATGRLKEMICSQHCRLLEVFCSTDQKCICFLCTMDEHKNHLTVSAEAERTEKQKQLWDIQRKFQQRIQEKEKELQKLKEAVDTHKRSAQAAVKDSERIFTELMHSIERRRSEVIQMIRDREKTEVRRAEGLLEQLKQEIDDMRRRDTELEQFLHTDDHIHFLQSFQSLSVVPASTENINISSFFSYDNVRKSISMLQDLCKEAIESIFSVSCFYD
ncbi:hypothetical protein cypCar_00026681, partial [Cyprinus carpio]